MALRHEPAVAHDLRLAGQRVRFEGGEEQRGLGIAKAFARTSVSFMRLPCSDDARSRPISFAAFGEVEGEHTF
jgi:hypothetical protein